MIKINSKKLNKIKKDFEKTDWFCTLQEEDKQYVVNQEYDDLYPQRDLIKECICNIAISCDGKKEQWELFVDTMPLNLKFDNSRRELLKNIFAGMNLTAIEFKEVAKKHYRDWNIN